MNTEVMFSSAKDDWETPPDLFAKLDAEFHFTLDVCADVKNTKCLRFYDKEADSLTKDWNGEVCWMNPPYGRDIGKWMRKAFGSYANGATTVVCLVPARTDTRWWHTWVVGGDAEVRFLRGRVKFVGAKAGAPFPSAIVIFRDKTEVV